MEIKEVWKSIKLSKNNSSNFKLEVSNLGNLRSATNTNKVTLLKGSTINGYKILKYSLFNEPDEKVQKQLVRLKKKVTSLQKILKTAQTNNLPSEEIKQIDAELIDQKLKLKQKSEASLKSRKTHHHILFHKAVAQYFLPKPAKEQQFVTHLDYNKLNNAATNLAYMSQAQLTLHNKKNPTVIAQMEKLRSTAFIQKSKISRLTITSVKQIRKLVLQKKSVASLAKQFNVSETQIRRIAKNENWKNVHLD